MGSSLRPLTELSIASLTHAPVAPFPYTELGRTVPNAVAVGPVPSRPSIPVLLTFNFANASRLAALLAELQNPRSSEYHHYLSAAEFDGEFGQPTSTYRAAVQYVEALGATNVRTSADRVSLSFDVVPSTAEAIFHASLDSYEVGGHTFYAPTSAPEFPAPLAGLLAGVDGLSSYSSLTNHPLHSTPVFRSGGVLSGPTQVPPLSAYPSPVMSGGFQFEFASDFQVAYDQLSLFAEEGYPTNMVAATILSAGTYEGNPITTPWGNLATGQSVGPFDPRDISDFYNETLPTGEPHASVTGVPLNGAPAPGPLASFDNTSANVENTLDLEMLGSTAPGARIYNVYGSTLSTVNLDDAFAYILNPNASFPALANVSVISNSWGGTDGFDAGWNASIATAAARGITVLVASGDSASNPNGDGGGTDPPGQTTFFPASMAFDTYGDVAVGGTTVALDPTTLQMSENIVWNQTAAWDSPNPAAGSTGGISAIFPAPDWQNDTSANERTHGLGRGVPDIAALANNTIMTITLGGVEYEASNASVGGFFFDVAGTSIASPLTAGMLVDADHVLGAFNNSWLGFLDPDLYALANAQYTTVSSSATSSTGYITTNPAYNTTLPTVPFYDVTVGQNFAYPALVGYDLVTGWGSVDAYNYTMYLVSYQPVNSPGDLSSLRANFNLTGLDVTSTSPYYNASIQQNFFVANALGAPIYWVQNVIYINGTPGAWSMNFSGWVVYPYWGLYSNESIYEYNFPLTGQVLNTPLDFSIQTTLENTTVFGGESVLFSFGIPGTSTLSLPLPGGSYILGALWNNYSWEGNEFANNPLEGGPPGSLSPQFGLVGGPSLGQGDFTSPTGGNLQLLFQRFGSTTWVPGTTEAYGEGIDQTGESALNLEWTQTSAADPATGTPANWSLGLSTGSMEQGVLEYDSAATVSVVPVTVSETGLPPGWTWGFFLNTGQGFFTSSPQAVLQLANGSYSWNAYPPSDYSLVARQGQFVIDGVSMQVSLVFQLVTYNVTLVALALPTGFDWWANVTETFDGSPTLYPLESNTTSITFAAANSTLEIAFAAQSNWTEQPHQIEFNVTGSNVEYEEAFSPPPTFVTTFAVAGLPAGANWTLNVSGQPRGAPTSAASVSLPLKNGSYSYVARTSLPGYFAVSGVFGVDGAAHEIFVSFLPAVYGVMFAESGLPAGSLWGLQILGGPYLSSEGDQLNWSAVNGTYNYTVLAQPAGWTAGAFSQGRISVNGSLTTLDILFTQVEYPVTFSMSGLPASESWGISLDGAPANFTTSSSLSFSLPNGTYTYSVSLPPGWSSSPPSATFSVTGQAGTISLVASQRSGTSGTSGPLGLGSWGYALIALLVLVVLVVLAVAFWRRRPPERPPEPRSPPSPPVAPPPVPKS
ncbi:MAG: protease pro-enzyme activation domain-containing protein [Thermoplasmata archaeon]